MVQGAKGVSLNPSDSNAQQNWRKANQNVSSIWRWEDIIPSQYITYQDIHKAILYVPGLVGSI